MTVEQRLEVLEKEVAELKKKVLSPSAKPNWLEANAGIFKGDPDFEEILRLGREIRQADRLPDDDGKNS